MCGIVGFVNDLAPEEKRRRLAPMMESVRHRGPDDAGIMSTSNCGGRVEAWSSLTYG